MVENGGMTGKGWEKDEGKSLKTGGTWRTMEEHGGIPGKKLGKNDRK